MRRNGPTYEELERRCRRAEALLETLRSEKESKNDDGTRELRGNERIYRSLCESMTEGLALHELLRDPSGRPVDYLLLDVNPAFERILGLRRDDVVGRGAREVYGVSEAPFLDLYARVATTGEPLSFEAGYEPMGRVFSVSVFSPGVNRFATMFHDVTDRARAEETLRRSEFLQRALVETIPDLVWLKDPEGVFLSCNPAFERFFGASEAEIVGRTDADFVAPELAEFFREHDRKALEAGGPSINEEWLVFADGGYRGLFETIKTPMRDVSGGLVGVLGISRDISARRRAEEALRESEERWRSYVENAPYSIFVVNENGRFLRVNPEACRVTGYGEEELLSRSLSDLLDPESRVVAERSFAELLRTGRAFSELGYVTKAGEKRWWALAAVRFSESRFLGYAGDITERRRGEEEREKLQAQLLQAQKMESVGRLAGGVAHDFNNMLGVIIGHAEMALEEEGETGRPHLQEIHKAALRSADLTRQLLAFARKQTVAPQILNLNDTVTNMLKILRRLIGEDIDLVWAPGVALWPVRVDPSQIDQILANLCVNARDAVAGVGKVLIETENVTLDETYCADRADFVPGDYVMLAVSDDGCGMDREMLSRIFEPFFTTKEMGQGTGLGLATVYGVVRQNEGYVNAYSEPGQGSTFRIYLPRHGDVLPPSPHKPVPARPGRGGETLLLVEDEPAILDVARIMLERLGYRVLTAGSPGEAIRLAREEPGRIHLLVTDVVMPEMNGRDLADRLRPLNHDMKILFMSGYTANVVAHRGVLDGGVSFLQKPFSVSALAAKVRDVLDGE